ncbi:MAG: tetratricopeptide repeat protein [SAR324 cluster bacterium]|nr:tetratricopeptide repeat protein [SAR324 cluster bacterium]
MLLPFIPFLLALAGLMLVGMQSAQPPPQGWELAVVYCVLPLLGAIVGSAPESLLGARTPLRVNRRRLVLLVLWIAAVAAMAVFHGWLALLAEFRGGEELALTAMLLNFWLSDGLALRPVNPLLVRGLREQLRDLSWKLGISLPIVVLVLMGLAVSGLGSAYPGLEQSLDWIPIWLQTLGSILIYVAVAGMVVPVLLPLCWRLRKLDSADAERVIREELAANGVSVARVLNWPAEMMGHATAGVVGIIPRFRFLLFADALAGALNEEEIRSVTAHEAEHIRQRHLWYFFAAIMTFVLFLQMVLEVLAISGLWLNYAFPFWALTVLEIGGLLLFLRFGLGFMSRYFERQADGNALRRRGFLPFQTAMLKISQLNGIRIRDDNWHHYGIGRRLAYLEEAAQTPDTLVQHDRAVRRIKGACLVLLALCVLAQTVFSSTGIVSYAVETYGLGPAADPSPAAVQGLQFLAMRAYERKDYPAAERYFRRLLQINPDDPKVQNNLAWLLVTRPGTEPYLVQEGLDLALRATHAAELAFIWDTLAEAHLRTGRFEKAAAAAEKALRLARENKGRGDTPLAYFRERAEQIGEDSGHAPSIR